MLNVECSIFTPHPLTHSPTHPLTLPPPNQKPETRNQKLQRAIAFTLVELLVVIAIIGILAALLLSAMAGAKSRAIRTKCLSNIKQLNTAVLIYAQENRDRLPDRVMDYGYVSPLTNASGYISTLMPVLMADYMRRNGYNPEAFFDPGLRKCAALDYLIDQWRVPPQTMGFVVTRAVGYALTFPATPNPPFGQTNLNYTIVPQVEQSGNQFLPAPNASRRVLTAGIVLSRGGTPTGGNTTGVPSGVTPSARYTYDYYSFIAPFGIGLSGFATNPPCHPDSSGRFPAGENAGMLDGSGQWRKFKTMIPRGTTGSFFAYDPANPTPSAFNFWW